MSLHGKAAGDGGTIFGLGTNQNPAAGWMLVHILDPNGDETIFPRVMNELQTAQKSDGSLDCHVLFGLPLLQSIVHEVLRLYADTLIVRDPNDNLILPTNDGRRQFIIPSKSTVMIPSWLAHYDDFWRRNDVSSDKFYAERFLKHDPESGEHTFTLAASNGRFFPFGGGHEICPGRVFAKQSMMIAVAITLLNFEIEPLYFIDGKGTECYHLPSFGKEYAGAGVGRMDGDLKVRLRRRTPPTESPA
jgi:cytochrome P450